MDKIAETAKALWGGEAPLRPAFWIYGFAGVLLFKWAMRLLSASDYAGGPLYPALAALAAAYSVFAAIAVWRSAARFEGDPRWAWAARAGVIAWPSTIFWGP